jgi:hypothetical protein
MSAALTLVVFIASRDATDPATYALKAAARVALGADVDVLVHLVSELPSDESALETGRTLSADAVAEVTWADAEHRHARLHVHTRAASHWIDRDIGFDPSDADAERGRTIGFSVAAMMPDQVRPSAPIRPLPVDSADVRPNPSTVHAADAGPHRTRGSLDVLLAGAAGGDATGIGGAVGVRYFLDSHLALTGAAGARVGQDSAAQATALILFAGPGLSWRAFPADARFRVGPRLDLFVMRESSSRADSPSAQTRWVAAADLLVEATLRMTPGAALLLGAGGETAFGTTDVFVRGQKVSTFPPLRFIATAGVEASF